VRCRHCLGSSAIFHRRRDAFCFSICDDNSNKAAASSGERGFGMTIIHVDRLSKRRKRSGNDKRLGSAYDLDLIPVPHSCDNVTIENPQKASTSRQQQRQWRI
jgi:hypothetical protein